MGTNLTCPMRCVHFRFPLCALMYTSLMSGLHMVLVWDYGRGLSYRTSFPVGLGGPFRGLESLSARVSVYLSVSTGHNSGAHRVLRCLEIEVLSSSALSLYSVLFSLLFSLSLSFTHLSVSSHISPLSFSRSLSVNVTYTQDNGTIITFYGVQMTRYPPFPVSYFLFIVYLTLPMKCVLSCCWLANLQRCSF